MHITTRRYVWPDEIETIDAVTLADIGSCLLWVKPGVCVAADLKEVARLLEW